MAEQKPSFPNTIPSAPNVESIVVRLMDMESRLDERFDLNRDGLIQMIHDSERVEGEKFASIYAVLAERDIRRQERYDEQERALTSKFSALKEQTALAFAASDKAITKSEMAQSSYNNTHNELARKMEDQYKFMIPRPEHTQQMANIDNKLTELKEANIALRIELTKEIQILREGRSVDFGEGAGKINQRELITWIMGLALAAIVVGGVIVDITLRLK